MSTTERCLKIRIDALEDLSIVLLAPLDKETILKWSDRLIKRCCNHQRIITKIQENIATVDINLPNPDIYYISYDDWLLSSIHFGILKTNDCRSLWYRTCDMLSLLTSNNIIDSSAIVDVGGDYNDVYIDVRVFILTIFIGSIKRSISILANITDEKSNVCQSGNSSPTSISSCSSVKSNITSQSLSSCLTPRPYDINADSNQDLTCTKFHKLIYDNRDFILRICNLFSNSKLISLQRLKIVSVIFAYQHKCPITTCDKFFEWLDDNLHHSAKLINEKPYYYVKLVSRLFKRSIIRVISPVDVCLTERWTSEEMIDRLASSVLTNSVSFRLIPYSCSNRSFEIRAGIHDSVLLCYCRSCVIYISSPITRLWINSCIDCCIISPLTSHTIRVIKSKNISLHSQCRLLIISSSHELKMFVNTLVDTIIEHDVYNLKKMPFNLLTDKHNKHIKAFNNLWNTRRTEFEDIITTHSSVNHNYCEKPALFFVHNIAAGSLKDNSIYLPQDYYQIASHTYKHAMSQFNNLCRKMSSLDAESRRKVQNTIIDRFCEYIKHKKSVSSLLSASFEYVR